tara:strand:+ start:53 stop:1177 length:1125 start_codon:yes stop_codon:yes gene_type:complete
MIKNLNYVTYQTFPAQTANSLQTISNIKYLIKRGVTVNLYFPLREKQSSAELKSLQDFYNFTETFNSFGVKHPYPHGKIKFMPKLWFHISHILWSKKLIKTNFKNDKDNYFFTRSDWIAYFLSKQGSKVIFECHQTSKVRNFVIKKIGMLENVKFIFLNENLHNNYKEVRQSIVLHNAADSDLLSSNSNKKENSIVFLGNTHRFNQSRGLGQIISWWSNAYLKENYTLEIIGGSIQDCDNLKNIINELELSNSIKASPWVDRKVAAKKLSKATFGLLINTSDNDHSYLYTSPLKYFEYLYSGLYVIAVDFPSHRTLPINEKVSFFENGNKESFINSLKNSKRNEPLSKDQLHITSLNWRAEKLIKFIFSTPGGI